VYDGPIEDTLPFTSPAERRRPGRLSQPFLRAHSHRGRNGRAPSQSPSRTDVSSVPRDATLPRSRSGFRLHTTTRDLNSTFIFNSRLPGPSGGPEGLQHGLDHGGRLVGRVHGIWHTYTVSPFGGVLTPDDPLAHHTATRAEPNSPWSFPAVAGISTSSPMGYTSKGCVLGESGACVRSRRGSPTRAGGPSK
jgi:hypothetical protein